MEAAIKQQQYEVVGSKKGMKEDGEGEKMDKGMEEDVVEFISIKIPSMNIQVQVSTLTMRKPTIWHN